MPGRFGSGRRRSSASDGAAIRLSYQSGFPDGQEPANTELELEPAQGLRDLYIGWWVWRDPNWEGHCSGINKEFYLFDDALRTAIIWN